MFPQLLIKALLITFATADTRVVDFDREPSVGVKNSDWFYGHENMNLINEIISDLEKNTLLKSRHSYLTKNKPLPPQDVKCLMSDDKFCSTEMKAIKGVLIRAVKNNCETCTAKEKENAGKVIAAMLAHDSVAWKIFLTRYS